MRLVFEVALVLGTSISTAVCQSASKLTFEAEDGVLSGTTVESSVAGFSGKGYVTGFDEATDRLTIKVDAATGGLYDLTIRYAGIYGEKRTSVVLNNGAASEVLLPETKTFADASGGQLLLKQGSNTIDIVSYWGWYLIDYISLSPTAAKPPHQINTSLVNPNADNNAKLLYAYLRSVYGKKILSGQHDLKYVDLIRTHTGKAPAIVSVDLMDYSPSRVERGTKATTIEDAITHHKQGGIVAAQWHWNAPTGLFDTEENKWWSGFYTRATDFDVAAALSDTTNANYTLLIRDIDVIANELKRLRDAGIAVLWRPLHEAEGAWFWWGAKGPEPAKKLWELLYDRLTNHHRLNNLIWVWNSIAKEWYPDEDTVDILSADVYAEGNGPMSTEYNRLIELGQDKKMVAAAEVGGAPLPELLQSYRTDWLYFAVWGDQFIDNTKWNSPEILKKVYTDEYVLTLDEIQGWQTQGARRRRSRV